MLANFQSRPSLAAPLVLSVLGVAYCFFIYLGIGESICITAGCSLYKSFAVYGVSLWLFGIGAFVVLTLLMAAGIYSLSLFFAYICVAADCILLLIMAATSPCLSCLGVALLFALTYFLLRRANSYKPRTNSALLFVWSMLFISNLVISTREILPPEPIYGNTQAPVHIYFSPTCESCLSVIEQFHFEDGQVAYFATSRNDTDLRMLIALKGRLDRGEKMPAALQAVKNSPALPEYALNRDNLLLQWQLLRNKATVIERSGGAVPYITINGAPADEAPLETLHGEGLDKLTNSAPSSRQERNDASSAAANQGSTNPGTALFEQDGAESSLRMHPDSAKNGTAPGAADFGLLLNNATGFTTCTDEGGQNCD